MSSLIGRMNGEQDAMMPKGGVWLLASDLGGEAAVTPTMLQAVHPLWAADVDHFGPWAEAPAMPGWLASGPVWKGQSREGGPAVFVCGPCASSLDVVWAMLSATALPAWSAVLAVSQSSGRGQYRRHWESPPGNVYAAWVLPDVLSGSAPGAPPFSGQLTPLLVGALLAEGLERVLCAAGASVRLAVKWPNDILLAGRKVGGILVEERAGRCVAGAGLNLASAPGMEVLRDCRVPAAGRLGETAPDIGPLRLWQGLAQAARVVFAERLAGQPAAMLSGFVAERLAWLGDTVEVRQAVCEKSGKHFDKLRGKIVGLLVDGALRLAVTDEEHHLISGSVMPAFGARG